VERAFKNQMLERDRGVERIADGVRQPAIALEALRKLRRALRVNEKHRAELFGLRPDGVELWIGKILARDATADLGAPEAKLFHRIVELLHRQIGELQGKRRKGGKAFRLRRAQLGELLVLQLDYGGGRVPVLAVPEWIDREHLHVDRHGVHLL